MKIYCPSWNFFGKCENIRFIILSINLNFPTDDQTGAKLGNINYLWEVQTKDGRSMDSSALAERVELMPAGDGSGYELKLIKVRPTANGLRLRCVLRGVPDRDDGPSDPGVAIPLGPEDEVPGNLIDISVEEDPDKPEPMIGTLEDIVPSK